MEPLADVRITRKGAQRIASGHPWIFSSDLAGRGSASPGSAVRVLDPGGKPLGIAHYSSTSQIALRMLSAKVEPIDRAFYHHRLQTAITLRERWVRDSDACRLVFGEADLLPGLVVDRYADCLAIQTLDQGMDAATPVLLECLDALCRPRAIVARNEASVRSRESLPLETRLLAGGLDGSVEIHMNGLRLHVDLLGGQKTGAYLDQRENYAAAARWAAGRALDCFTSTGGFALHLARVCDTVEAVDSSAPALAIARQNAEANGIGNIHWIEADVFDLLAGHQAARRHFDTIVLDPPAFAKSRGNIEAALRGYKEINRRALQLLAPGGVLITCSCSHHVSEAALLEAIAEASLDARRPLRVLERRTQAPDHPILLTVPETLYLKFLVLQAVTP